MDELGAAFRRVAEFRDRQRINPAAISGPRLEEGNLPARARKFAGRHQARGTGANDDQMGWLAISH